MIHVIANGFIYGKETYLRNAWNWIDFIVVVSSLLSLHPALGNVSFLRAFRLFRPLRSVKELPNMKVLVNTLLNSLVNLGQVLIFAIFFMLIFSILGTSLWAGAPHYRC